MYEHEVREANGQDPTAARRVEREGPDWAERATAARQREWSSDRELDPGDTHEKGEASLCVGEAA